MENLRTPVWQALAKVLANLEMLALINSMAKAMQK